MLIAPDVTRIFIVESQALFGKALCQILSLEPTFQVVGDHNGILADRIRLTRPDVIVLDLDGLSGDVSQLIGSCKSAAPQAKVCVLSMRVQPELLHRCMAASAQGFIMKDVTPSELVQALKTLAGGQAYVDPRAAGRLLQHRNTDPGDFYNLSSRELDIAKLVAEGLSNKEVSARLSLSEKTVKNHMGRIFAKLNISARSQVAIYAIKNGLI